MAFCRPIRVLWPLIVAFLFLGCQNPSLQHVSPELQPPPNATKIKHDQITGFERIDYVVDEEFPPHSVMAHLIDHIERGGWHALADSPFNQGAKSAYVEGWRKRVVATGANSPRRWAYLWWAQWENDQGNVLDVVLSYSYPHDAAPQLTRLTVVSSIATRERLRQAGLTVGQARRVSPGVRPVLDAVIEEPELSAIIH